MLIHQIRQNFVLYDTVHVPEQRNPTKAGVTHKIIFKD